MNNQTQSLLDFIVFKEHIKANLDNVNDTILCSVLDKFIQRSELGLLKYGTNLDREDLTTEEWIIHAQEEHMDAILYLEKLRKVIVDNNKNK
jgi:hypothetical protein